MECQAPDSSLPLVDTIAYGPVFSGSDARAIELEASGTLLECRDNECPLFEVADVARDNVLLVIGRIMLLKADIEAG